MAPPTSRPAALAVRAPRAEARRASSSRSVVLPIPGSPVTTTTRPLPRVVARQAASRTASSGVRPKIDTAARGAAPDATSACNERVVGLGATPRSARRRSVNRCTASAAPARSPSATRARTSARCADSSHRATTQRRRAQSTASRVRPSARACSASTRKRAPCRSRYASRSVSAHSSSIPGSSSPSGTASPSSSVASTQTGSANPSVSRAPVNTRSAASPQAWRSAQTVVRSRARACASSASGQSAAATRPRDCSPGWSPSHPTRARTRSPVGTGSGVPSASAATRPTR